MQGSDVFAHLTSLARLNGLRCVRASVVPDTASSRGSKPGGRYGATVFEVYGGSKAWLAGVERSVKLLNDGGKWRFIQDGPPLPFEDLDAYKARRVKDRFRVALLDKYLGQMGLRPFDEAFCAPSGSGVLIEKHGAVVDASRSLTLGGGARLVLGRQREHWPAASGPLVTSMPPDGVTVERRQPVGDRSQPPDR